MSKREWSLYIIETECGKLYTGISKDVEQRFEQHQTSKKGAKFFRSAVPKEIVFTLPRLTHSEALKLEARAKKLTRGQKKALIESGEFPFS